MARRNERKYDNVAVWMYNYLENEMNQQVQEQREARRREAERLESELLEAEILEAE